MGNFRPLPLKCWEAFLILHGFLLTKRTKGSHAQGLKKGLEQYFFIPAYQLPILSDFPCVLLPQGRQ